MGGGGVSERIEVVRATGDHAPAVAELFERSGVPCFCQYYQYPDDARSWQMRCAGQPEANRAGLARDLTAQAVTAFVATTERRADGWMRVDGPQNLQKMYQGRLYKGLPCFDGPRDGVLAIACFLVAPEARRRGVARSLLRHGLAWARSQGVKCVEAFPRGVSDVSCGEQWTGPLSLFESEGFIRVHDFAPYPVLRLTF